MVPGSYGPHSRDLTWWSPAIPASWDQRRSSSTAQFFTTELITRRLARSDRRRADATEVRQWHICDMPARGTLSAYRGRAEVIGTRANRREGPKANLGDVARRTAATQPFEPHDEVLLRL